MSVKKSWKPRNWPMMLVHNFEEITGSVLLVLMCLITILQAGSRFLSKIHSDIKPVYWTEEACTLVFIWLSFIGASLALKTGDHFAVEVIRNKVRPSAREILNVISALIIVLFSLLLVCFGFIFTVNGSRAITPSLQIPKYYVYAAVPAGGGIMLIRSVHKLLKSLSFLKKLPEG